MKKSPYPPEFIKLPVSVALADLDASLIVTMTRIIGLCGKNQYRKSLPYRSDELAPLLGRPRTTLYRHLNHLERLGWLRLDRSHRRIVLRPLIPEASQSRPGPKTSGPPQSKEDGPALPATPASSQAGFPAPCPEPEGPQALPYALEQAGIVAGPARLLLDRGADPTHIRGWHLWTCAAEQKWIDNPAGYIVSRLRRGDPPPPEYIELARLTAAEMGRLKEARVNSEQHQGWPSLNGEPHLQRLAPLWLAIDSHMRNRA
jgi:hypothetical protein